MERIEPHRREMRTETEPGTGLLFVLSGPSGVGKDTLLDSLLDRLPGLVRSVSATTRERRPAEIDGRDYHFFSTEEFDRSIADGRFLEYARYGEALYGTPREGVAQQRALGRDVVLKIEVQGALQVRERAPDAILIFIRPPSEAELERRLRARRTESEDRIAERLRIAFEEMSRIPEYDYVVTNDSIEEAVDALRCIVIAERHRNRHGRCLRSGKAL